MSKLTRLERPLIRQLTLPWPEEELPRPPILADGPCLPPQQVWASLSPTDQAQLRQTILRLIQEVLNDAAQS